jgi:hypothetical protein
MLPQIIDFVARFYGQTLSTLGPEPVVDVARRHRVIALCAPANRVAKKVLTA